MMRCEYELRAALRDFLQAAQLAGIALSEDLFDVTILTPPHKAGTQPRGSIALYAFHHDSKWLKIGIVGAKSAARFYSHHYHPARSVSSLAKSIMLDSTANAGLTDDTVGEWIRNHCTRINIIMPEKVGMPVLRLLEAFFHVRFSPIYER